LATTGAAATAAVADTLTGAMRVLVVTNFLPDASTPQRGRWVRDQVAELRDRGVDVEVFEFPPGSRHYGPATLRLRRLLRRRRLDHVHVH
jgi:hypothetical protein